MVLTNKNADDLLSSLGRSIGIDTLAFDKSGYCCLGFDSVIVNLERDQVRREFLLYAEIAPLSSTIDREALLDMLQANHYAMMTGSGCIGIDRAADRIYMSDRMLMDGLDSAGFANRIAQFVERAEAWQQHLAKGAQSDATATDVSPREDFSLFRI